MIGLILVASAVAFLFVAIVALGIVVSGFQDDDVLSVFVGTLMFLFSVAMCAAQLWLFSVL